jgi:hypothetical protein
MPDYKVEPDYELRDDSLVRYRQVMLEAQKTRFYLNCFFIFLNVLILAIGVYFHANVDQFFQTLNVVGSRALTENVKQYSSTLSLVYLMFFPIIGVFISFYWYAQQQSLLRQERSLSAALLSFSREQHRSTKSVFEIEWDIAGHERGPIVRYSMLTKMVIILFAYFHIALIAIAMYRVFSISRMI